MIKKLLLCAALLIGCASHQDSTGVGNPGLTQEEQALADDGDEGTKTGDAASSIVSIPMIALRPMDISTEVNAATRAETTPAFLISGCMTTVRDMNKVTFTFTNCNLLKLGLIGMNGQLEATYKPTATPGEVAIDMKSNGLKVESLTRDLKSATVDVSVTANATIKFEGAIRRIHWAGQYVASVATFSITQQPTYDIVVDSDSGCVSVDGGAITNATLFSTVAGYHRCGARNKCPDPGGTVTFVRKPGGPQITLEFLGGTAARVTGPKREPITLPNLLKCVP